MFSPSLANIRTELANLSYLPVMGNHEGSGSLFLRYFPQPYVAAGYWSFDYGPVHVVMMDQYVSYGSGSAEYNWVKSDLAATTQEVESGHDPRAGLVGQRRPSGQLHHPVGLRAALRADTRWLWWWQDTITTMPGPWSMASPS